MQNSAHLPNGQMQQQRNRGMLIVLEGLDRSGKTTQAKLLLNYMQAKGMNARIQRFPDREEPTTGHGIDTFLRNAKTIGESREAIHLLFAANRWLLNDRMRKDLVDGQHLIVDRYSHSGIAYSLAKGLDRRWVCQPEVGLLRPDLILFFDAHPEKVAIRGGFGQEVMERSDFQKAVYAKMEELFDQNYWRRIDAAHSVEEVHKVVVNAVTSLLESEDLENKPLEEFSPADFGL